MMSHKERELLLTVAGSLGSQYSAGNPHKFAIDDAICLVREEQKESNRQRTNSLLGRNVAYFDPTKANDYDAMARKIDAVDDPRQRRLRDGPIKTAIAFWFHLAYGTAFALIVGALMWVDAASRVPQ